MNPIIEVTNDTATGHWLLFQPCTDGTTGEAVWLAATYNDEYVKSDGVWLMRPFNYRCCVLLPVRQGCGLNNSSFRGGLLRNEISCSGLVERSVKSSPVSDSQADKKFEVSEDQRSIHSSLWLDRKSTICCTPRPTVTRSVGRRVSNQLTNASRYVFRFRWKRAVVPNAETDFATGRYELSRLGRPVFSLMGVSRWLRVQPRRM